MTEDLRLDINITEDDYINFNIFHLDYSKSMKRMLFILRFILPLIFFTLPISFIKKSNIPLWYTLTIAIIVYIVWVLKQPKSLRNRLAKRVSKMLGEGKNIGLLGNHSISFGKEGISNKSEGGETKSNWNAVEDIVESKDYIFIYISSVMAYIIPKRCFSSETEQNDFINKIKEMKKLYLSN